MRCRICKSVQLQSDSLDPLWSLSPQLLPWLPAEQPERCETRYMESSKVGTTKYGDFFSSQSSFTALLFCIIMDKSCCSARSSSLPAAP